MRRIGIVSGVLFVAVIVFCTSCTAPTAGTETGNPDITACLASALHTFDTLDAWLPTTYLAEGDAQLNPGRITDAWHLVGVAKKMEDSTLQKDSLSGRQAMIISRFDTVIIVDTQFVRDTLIIDTLITDLFKQVSADSLTYTLYTAQYTRYDSVFIVDTNVVRDTIVRVFQDTVYIVQVPTDKIGADTAGRVVYVTPKNNTTPVYVVNRDPVTNEVTLTVETVVPGATTPSSATLSSEVRTLISYTTVSRQSISSSEVVTETFNYTSDNSLSGGHEAWAASSVPVAHGTISSATALSETISEVDFDAGKDKLYATTSDNRIYALQKTTKTGALRVDNIVYGAAYFGSHADTVYLKREQVVSSGSIDRQVVTYRSLANSEDVRDHRQNRMFGCARNVYFSGIEPKSMTLDIVLDQPVERGGVPSRGSVTGTIDFGRGVSGIFVGVIDFTTKTVSGNYDYAGRLYTFNHSLGLEKAHMERVEP